MNLWLIFLTGLTTGGISCLAMQGGLLASIIANQKGKELAHPNSDTKAASFDQLDWMPVMFFLIVKLIAHMILGFLLGWVGSFFTLSLGVRLAFQVGAAGFMLATAMNLLEVHPIFRLVVMQPPKFLQRFVRNSTKTSAFFSPALLGFMTIFIPCGVTQAMEVVAISSGSALVGALTMGAFVLGTAPAFSLIGIATAKLSESMQKNFLQSAAVVLMFMAFYSFNGVLTVIDAPFTAQKIIAVLSDIGRPPQSINGNVVAKQTISITSAGYSPTFFTVKAGVPLELTLQSTGAYTCASSFTFRKFNIFEQLGPTDQKVITFTPTEKGEFTFSCSMGMYRGTMRVI
jgi:sulfite exporter TauE/SafE